MVDLAVALLASAAEAEARLPPGGSGGDGGGGGGGDALTPLRPVLAAAFPPLPQPWAAALQAAGLGEGPGRHLGFDVSRSGDPSLAELGANSPLGLLAKKLGAGPRCVKIRFDKMLTWSFGFDGHVFNLSCFFCPPLHTHTPTHAYRNHVPGLATKKF